MADTTTLHPMDLNILTVIDRIRGDHQACTWGEVANQLHVSKAYISERATRLQRLGYVDWTKLAGSVRVVRKPAPLPPPSGEAALLPPPSYVPGVGVLLPPIVFSPHAVLAKAEALRLAVGTNPVTVTTETEPTAPPVDDLAARIAAAAATINVPAELIAAAKRQAERVHITPDDIAKEKRNASDRAKRAAAGGTPRGTQSNNAVHGKTKAPKTRQDKLDERNLKARQKRALEKAAKGS